MDTDLDNHLELRPSSFEDFYRLSWLGVYKPLVATIADPDLAAEAVDEAMVRAYARWSGVSAMANPGGWIYRVAYRYAIDRLRRHGRERKLLPRLIGAGNHREPLVEPGLAGALDVLPTEQRAVVVLACGYDWSERDIADALGVRPGTVKSRLSRGLARLREEMGA